MQAIILAGGFGTRLQSVVANVPKPMAPIHGKPFLAYLLDYLQSQGISNVVLSVHYLREQIQDYFKNSYRDIAIEYAIEEAPLGTGGAILKSLSLANQNQPIFVINGDTFLKLNYRDMFSQHQENHAALTIALSTVPNCSRYGAVIVDHGIVTQFKEKGELHSGLINAGVYLLSPGLLAESLPEKFSFETDFLFPKVKQLKPQAFISDEYFIDIGIPEDYARATAEFSPLAH